MSDLDRMRRRSSIQGPPSPEQPGLVRATVADNNDPAKRGRLRVIIPEVSGDEAPHPEWAWPAAGLGINGQGGGKQWGNVWIPEPGDVVAIVFVDGDPDHPSWLPGWVLDGALPALLAEHYPKRRGLVTPSGHALFFDDSDGGAGDVVLRQRDGANLRLGGDGTANIDAAAGAKAKIQGGGPAAVRVGDRVSADSSMAAWLAAAQTVLAAAAALTATPVPVAPTDFGKASTGSSKTEIG